MKNVTYTDAILALRPEATFNIFENDYTSLKWYDKVQKAPTKKEVEDKHAELVAIEESSVYRYMRQAEYPSIGDQLDALFRAGAFPKEMADKIQAVKDKYPKG